MTITYYKKSGIMAALSSALLLAACGEDSSTSTTSIETRDITLDFRAINSTVSPEVDITADICGTTLSAVGTESTDAGIAYMGFYVSEVNLVTAAGNKVRVTLTDNSDTQEQGVALVDFRNKTSGCSGDAKTVVNTVTGSYEHTSGTDYTGVEFQLGLPADINHADVNTAGILSKAVDMHWNWLGGYRYLRMDLVPAGGITKADSTSATNWNVHLGATGCSNADENDGTSVSVLPPSSTCTNTNLSVVALDGFDPASSRIGVDIGAMYAGSNLAADKGGSTGCMSGTTDPECAEIFARLGLTHDQQAEALENTTTAIQQVVFRTLND